ncbi:MAG: peptide chain release factor N(5)-glutamine methyltransferase [Phycisphaerae bacterium]
MTTVPAEVWTIGRLLSWTQQFLAARSVDEPRLATELLLAHALGCRKIDLYTRFADVPPDAARDAFRELVRRAADHAPIAYLVGHKEFYGIDLCVSPAVLIPRPETERLVEHAVTLVRQRGAESCTALDIGTGSGCIALALARLLPGAAVVATDTSADALAVARDNAARLALTERVHFALADACDLPAELRPAGGFDLILSNPPYIAEPLRDTLPANVRDYEPHAALFGGPDGLAVMRRIAAGAAPLLAPAGRMMIEIADGQAAAARDCFAAAGWRCAETLPDAAHIPRVLVLERAP